MRFAHFSTLIGLIALAGCASGPEAAIVGTWKLKSSGASVTFNGDKTYTEDLGRGMTVTGVWKVDKGDVVATPQTFGGHTIDDIRNLATQTVNGQSPSPQAKGLLDAIDKPNVMKINPDGETLTTDQTRDKNSGAPQTLTKIG